MEKRKNKRKNVGEKMVKRPRGSPKVTMSTNGFMDS